MIATDPGFRANGVITASIELPPVQYDTDGATAFFTRALERIHARPEVRAVAFSSDLPWTGYDENTGFDIVGRKFPDARDPAPGITSSLRDTPPQPVPSSRRTRPLVVGCQRRAAGGPDQRDRCAQVLEDRH